MSVSTIDIVNRALDKVGYGAITSFTDGTKTSSLAQRTWVIVLDAVLRDHPWNFAVVRTILASTTSTPSWGFSYKFPLPDDCLRVLDVLDLSAGEYQIEGRFILADEDTLYLRYISRITDTSKYDGLFIECLASRLAVEMCESLTQSNAKKNIFIQEYQELLSRAKYVDAVENPPVTFEEDTWIEVRY